jgi:hypothetical protein
MKKKIYIASSWKNQHGVEMLTMLLRDQGHEVLSWIENNHNDPDSPANKDINFEEWINTEAADQSFNFDTKAAVFCDLLIYYGPSGKDSALECGIAYGHGVPMVALHAKGEDFGLMRKCFSEWFTRFGDLLQFTDPKNGNF